LCDQCRHAVTSKIRQEYGRTLWCPTQKPAACVLLNISIQKLATTRALQYTINSKQLGLARSSAMDNARDWGLHADVLPREKIASQKVAGSLDPGFFGRDLIMLQSCATRWRHRPCHHALHGMGTTTALRAHMMHESARRSTSPQCAALGPRGSLVSAVRARSTRRGVAGGVLPTNPSTSWLLVSSVCVLR
jgi:hypothetical protein